MNGSNASNGSNAIDAIAYMARPSHVPVWERAPHMRAAHVLSASILHAAPMQVVAAPASQNPPAAPAAPGDSNGLVGQTYGTG